MSSYHRLTLIVIIISLFICLTYSQSLCTQFSAGIGCTACTSTDVLAYNKSSALYTCIGVANCAVVVGSDCVKCAGPYFIYSNTCLYLAGCRSGNTTYCFECDTDYVLLLDGTCFKKNITYCSVYNQTQCIECQYNLMDPTDSCSINSSICQLFDYSIMKCIKCDINQTIKSDGMGCNNIVDNCQVYDNGYQGLCLLCKQNYMYIDAINACVGTQSLGVNEQILVYNYSTSTYIYQYTCLDNSKQVIGFGCFIINSTVKHCKTIVNSTCLQCLNGYYNSTSNYCTQCDIKISNCALCPNSTYCTACMHGYYKLIIDTATSKCMPCLAYNCLHCSTQLNANNQVQCLSCPANYTLYAGTCFNCQNSSYAYSIIQSKCLSCNESVINCRFCKFTGNSNQTVICIQCIEDYYYSQISKKCQLITNITINSTDILQSSFEILRKLGPGIERPLYNNRSGLMSICNQTDGYVCICSVVTDNQTSFCSNFVDYNTTNTIMSLINYITNAEITTYPNQFRMAAQFPAFPSTKVPLTNQSYSQYQFWNFLSAYTYMLQRNLNISIAQKLIQHAVSMDPVFSDQKITILRGNGFYYKYIPAGLASGGVGDDDYIYTTLNNTLPVSIYVFYSRYNISGLITGAIYVTSNHTNNFTVRVRKTRHFDDQTNTSAKVSGVVDSTLNSTLSGGMIVITNFPKSKAVEIYSTVASITEDTYQSQRIQNIFYSQSWLYILFFIALYLIFIPLCAIVDCCQSEQYTRKKVGEQQPSDKSDETTIIRINYRQFFPLYNAGNTPRPRRLAKVCLFIVNMQHIITFLTLVYFNLPENTPIGAIALVIPAYIMVVIMGYICGAIFRKLRGHFKYLINVFSLGYWFLWFFLMRNMAAKSSQYRLYILVFTIICFFLDLLIDALETLLVYFAIKQGQSQVNLFNCLARWLSYRGFYQFDKLAKEIQGQSE